MNYFNYIFQIPSPMNQFQHDTADWFPCIFYVPVAIVVIPVYIYINIICYLFCSVLFSFSEDLSSKSCCCPFLERCEPSRQTSTHIRTLAYHAATCNTRHWAISNEIIRYFLTIGRFIITELLELNVIGLQGANPMIFNRFTWTLNLESCDN